jgi:hypothetical protein
MSEHLTKPAERELEEARGYLFDLLDQLNELMVREEALLSSKGILPRLSLIVSLVTMHRYQMDLVAKNYWPQLDVLISQLSQIPELKDKLREILADAEAIRALIGVSKRVS